MSERDQLEFWTRTLNLPDFRVVHQVRTGPDDPICFTVRPSVECGVCPRCHKATDYVNRTTESSRVKDLPLGDQPVELVVRTLQFHCQDCDCYFTPHYPAFAPGAHATERFLQQAAKLIRFSDIYNAACFFAVPPTTLCGGTTPTPNASPRAPLPNSSPSPTSASMNCLKKKAPAVRPRADRPQQRARPGDVARSR